MFDQTPHAADAAGQTAPPRRPRIVIVGAGFGGLAAAKALSGADADVTLVDRRNYHLFQPLLYQVATAGLSPAQIATPIRAIVADAANVRVVMGRATGVDTARRLVRLEERELPYDYLVLATGARHSYFGRDEWEQFAPGLKKIDDATEIRRRILTAFEQAETEADPEKRRRLLNFVVIGAGPTGVEMAGAIAELARRALARDFRTIDPRQARIVLVEAGPSVLAAFPEKLSAWAARALGKLGVEVMLGMPVTACDAEGVVVGDERIPAATIMWAAGVAASPAAKWLAAEADRAGRLKVLSDLSVPGHPEIFAIGDTALSCDAGGKPYPGLAPVAKQQGEYIARLLRARLAGRTPAGPFRYRDSGTMATIGRGAAIAKFSERLQLTGFVAWVLWGLVHIFFLIGFRNRFTVLADWMWSYVTFQSGARLITGKNSE
ncbi:MAG: NAD(P)/FAD-dependent oxidoreductase [Alphaproteobacteria bacterium]|nr:NAD(P)/FAD-dependent oxidoreductase [Alphaproteobacteria bacterium]MCW5741824.1 NAD(P)/FAD-dependent oxidoreductase [Alphaproteobacteria bacterium]